MDQTGFNMAGDEINVDDCTDATVYCQLCNGGRSGRRGRISRVGMRGMEGWRDERMGGWVDGWMGGWVDVKVAMVGGAFIRGGRKEV